MQQYDYRNLHARFVQRPRKNTSTMIKHNKIYKKSCHLITTYIITWHTSDHSDTTTCLYADDVSDNSIGI